MRTILKDWPGTPQSAGGRFYHPDYPFELGWADVLKWKSGSNPYAAQKKNDTWRLPVVQDEKFLHGTADVAAWLGHASFFFRINGRTFLTDPVFGKLSPLTPRYSELPVSPEKLLQIDYLLITHDHRDHCDEKSLRLLLKNNPKAQVLTGLGMKSLLERWSADNEIFEMGWFQQFENPSAGLSITYLPTRHWGRRWLTDTNRRLWGAFVLQTENRTIYFGGDSGYGAHFTQTASLFSNIDAAFLGIGAFAPEWFMQTNHMSPADAWQAFQDLKAQQMIPMHYGTFDLSDEPLGEPERLLKKIVAEKRAEAQVAFLKVGETMRL